VATQRILYLEDDASTRQAMVYILEAHGYEVYSYPSAEAAAPHLSQDGLDLAIMDVRLPGRRGDDFGRELAEKHPALRILFLTAEADIDAIKHLVPGSMVIRKPVDVEALLELIKCDSEKQQSQDDQPPNSIPFPPQAG